MGTAFLIGIIFYLVACVFSYFSRGMAKVSFWWVAILLAVPIIAVAYNFWVELFGGANITPWMMFMAFFITFISSFMLILILVFFSMMGEIKK